MLSSPTKTKLWLATISSTQRAPASVWIHGRGHAHYRCPMRGCTLLGIAGIYLFRRRLGGSHGHRFELWLPTQNRQGPPKRACNGPARRTYDGRSFEAQKKGGRRAHAADWWWTRGKRQAAAFARSSSRWLGCNQRGQRGAASRKSSPLPCSMSLSQAQQLQSAARHASVRIACFAPSPVSYGQIFPKAT
eukprot:scaffold32663_cov30-Tisochrysis_lutea.AAC.4